MVSVPTLAAVEAVPAADVERLILTIQAELASLTRRCQVLQTSASEATEAPLAAASPGPLTFLGSNFDEHFQAKRAELARALAQARTEASQRVRAAEVRAAGLLASPNAQLDGQDLRRYAPIPPGPSRPDFPPAPPVQPKYAAFSVAAGPAMVTLSSPANAPGLTPPRREQRQRQQQRELQREQQREERRQRPVAPPRTPAVPRPERVPRAPKVVPVQVPANRRPSQRRGVRRFLYLDTVLPMLAVLIVLVVLLAWMG